MFNDFKENFYRIGREEKKNGPKIGLWFYVKLPLLSDKTICRRLPLSVSIASPSHFKELPPAFLRKDAAIFVTFSAATRVQDLRTGPVD